MNGFDPYHPDFLEDPYPYYREILRSRPAFEDSAWGLTFFASHRDVTAILKDRERFGRDFRHRIEVDRVDQSLYTRTYPEQWPTWTAYIRESFLDMEPPRHTRMRRLVSAAFTRRSSEVFRPRLEESARSILEAALEAGSIEVISEFATPIPVAMIADLMGIPRQDHDQLLDWSHAIVKVFDQGVTAEDGAAAELATRDFVAYLEQVLAERRRSPGDDLISAMLDVSHEGDTLTDPEIVATAILTLNAGHEATVHAIGNGLLSLARDPAAYSGLRNGGAPIASAVDELLRFDSPLQMFERWVLEDTEVAGRQLVAGSKVGLLFGAANHDPAVFASPEKLELGRDPNPHVSFGAGLHFCVGAPLARVELEAALGTWARMVRSMDLRDVGERLESLVFRGVGRLEMELEAA